MPAADLPCPALPCARSQVPFSLFISVSAALAPGGSFRTECLAPLGVDGLENDHDTLLALFLLHEIAKVWMCARARVPGLAWFLPASFHFLSLLLLLLLTLAFNSLACT